MTASSSSFEGSSTEQLLQRRGELCAAAQLAVLEGIAEVACHDEATEELRALDDVLRQRGVDPHRV
jgi:hypothetical protein